MSSDITGGAVPPEPGLEVLLGLLTADPEPGELAGESAAAQMFLANAVQPDTAELEPVPGEPEDGQPAPWRPLLPPAWRARFLAGAAALVMAAAFAGAAYAGALPAPLQQAAYHVLGFAGIPAARPAAPAGSHRTGPASAHGATPGPSSAGRPASPSASTSPAGPGAGSPTATGLSIAALGRITADGGDVFLGRLTDNGQAVAGATVTLLERPAGQSAWQPTGTAMTGHDGVAAVRVSGISTNTVFQLTGPGGMHSGQFLVVVVPPVSASIVGGTPSTLTVSSPLADPGDGVVLQTETSDGWESVQSGKLDADGQAEFQVWLPAGHHYRVVLLPTALHGLSVSNTATVPLR